VKKLQGGMTYFFHGVTLNLSYTMPPATC